MRRVVGPSTRRMYQREQATICSSGDGRQRLSGCVGRPAKKLRSRRRRALCQRRFTMAHDLFARLNGGHNATWKAQPNLEGGFQEGAERFNRKELSARTTLNSQTSAQTRSWGISRRILGFRRMPRSATSATAFGTNDGHALSKRMAALGGCGYAASRQKLLRVCTSVRSG